MQPLSPTLAGRPTRRLQKSKQFRFVVIVDSFDATTSGLAAFGAEALALEVLVLVEAVNGCPAVVLVSGVAQQVIVEASSGANC